VVEAKVSQDLKAADGQVIVPKDTKVIAHVTEAQARSKEQKESQVGIAFDRAAMKNGNDLVLPMLIQAIIAPSSLGAGATPGEGNPAAPAQSPGGMPPSAGANHGNGRHICAVDGRCSQ